MCLQTDGNIVLYASGSAYNKVPVWASNTQGNIPRSLILQGDGDLVAYGSSGSAYWSTGTHNKGSAPYKAVMQNDGNFVLYDGTDKYLWATHTSQPSKNPTSFSLAILLLLLSSSALADSELGASNHTRVADKKVRTGH
jgi:hypothetical protein